jgi:hypothetical protein
MSKRGEIAIGLVALIALGFYLFGHLTANYQTNKGERREQEFRTAKK